MKQVLSDLDFGSATKILNLPTPATSGEPATKGFVESLINGMAWKDAVRVASVANITIASPGATLDGVAMATNDRVLCKDQTVPSENGIYVWNGAATPMTRAADFDATGAELEGAVIPVEEGTANAGTRWYLTTQNPTIGSALAFANSAGGAPTASTTVAGLVELATQGEVDAGTASPTNLVVQPSTLVAWSGRPFKFNATIGDGSATQIDVTHNLNTLNVSARVRVASTGKEVDCEVTNFSVNVCRFNFAVAPALNSLAVNIDG